MQITACTSIGEGGYSGQKKKKSQTALKYNFLTKYEIIKQTYG